MVAATTFEATQLNGALEALCKFVMLHEALCELWTPVKLLLHRVR